jgi:hypothetical protein
VANFWVRKTGWEFFGGGWNKVVHDICPYVLTLSSRKYVSRPRGHIPPAENVFIDADAWVDTATERARSRTLATVMAAVRWEGWGMWIGDALGRSGGGGRRRRRGMGGSLRDGLVVYWVEQGGVQAER